MKISIESTTKVVNASGIPCRVWEGKTESGVDVVCLIPRIAVPNGQDASEFEKELQEHAPPSPITDAFPLRMIL
jgi:hypothetical protein